MPAVEMQKRPSVPLAVIRRQARPTELVVVVPECCGIVWQVVKAQKAAAGRHVALYWDDSIRLEVGVELLGPFVDVKTGEPNTTFPVNGKGRILYDDKSLYVGIEVEDKDITGGFPADAKDPHLWTKDTVELMIDPDWDRANTNYYEIQIGPQNLVFDTQWDDYNTPKPSPEGPFGHQDWSAGLKSAVVVDGTIDKSDDVDKGYVVEAAIPWKSFSKAKKTPPELGDAWRINLYAMEKNSGVAWSPILGRGNFHRSSRFGRVKWVKKGWAPPAPSGAASAAASGAPARSAAVAPSAKPPAATPAPKPASSAP